MNEAFAKAIEELQAQMRPLEEQIKPVIEQITAKKKLVNSLCDAAGAERLYTDVDVEKPATIGLGPITSDQFFGKPTATVAGEILERRKQAGLGAISLADLYDAMKAGGFEFESKDADVARRGIAITLGKNSAKFIRIPSTGAWGLTAWYPNAKRNKQTASSGGGTGTSPANEDGADSAQGGAGGDASTPAKAGETEPVQK